jgi:hypothetical protein
MVNLKIDSGMVYRSALGAGLKSIGGLYRVQDMPEAQQKLKRQVFMREALVVGAIFVASIFLEGAFANLMPRLKKSLSEGMIQLVQFVPQALAYVVAESGSRQVFPVRQSFEKALEEENEAAFTPNPVPRENPFVTSARHYESLATSQNHFTAPASVFHSIRDAISQEASRVALFQAQSPYPHYWESKRQPMTMRGFY